MAFSKRLALLAARSALSASHPRVRRTFSTETQTSFKHQIQQLQSSFSHMEKLHDSKIAELKAECEGLMIGKCATLDKLACQSECKLVKTEYELTAEMALLKKHFETEVAKMNAELSSAKIDIVKLCVGAFFSGTALVLGALRLFPPKQN